MNKPEHTIRYYENGQVSCEEWRVNNQLHRVDGPANISYYKNAQVKYEEWHINDKQLTKEQIKEIKWSLQFNKDLEETLSVNKGEQHATK